MKKRVLTGIKPTNKLHIGNYIGAIKQIIDLSKIDNNEIFLFVPNLHALTDDNNIKESISSVMKVYLSLCNNNIKYYIQSNHPEITYISWVLSCCTPIGHLQRMTQYKSKESKNLNSGYLYYPVLMAADILSIDSDIIPVGVDQKQHIELTRDICDYFKNKFNADIFKKPEARVFENIKINSLQDSSKKMSKSDINDKATIFLTDSPEVIKNKISKAITDQHLMPFNIESIKDSRPEIYNLCVIFKEINNKDFQYIEKTFGNGYISNFKNALTDSLIDFLIPLQQKMNKIDDQYINEIINRDYFFIDNIIKQKVCNINNILGISINLQK